MRNLKEAPVHRYRAKHPRNNLYNDTGMEELVGFFLIPAKKAGALPLRVIASNALGWEHVSVSVAGRCPTWDEMCRVKDLFFTDDECVVQYHPPKSDYVNFHAHTLHLWRKPDEEFPRPPKELV